VVPGLEGAFAALREPLDLAFHHADLLARLGTRPQVGLLVVGPAGSGKASVVNAAAAATGAQVVRVWGPRLAGLEPAAAVAELTSAVQAVHGSTPAVLLVEDVDALAPADPNGAAALLVPLVDVVRALVAEALVAVVCTTSQPEQVSATLRGPGLLEREVLLALPTRDQRRAMLGHLTRGMPLDPDVALDDLAGRTPGFVLADLESLAREAALRAAHRQRDEQPDGVPRVAATDFAAALAVVRPTALAGQALDTPDLTLDDVGDMAEVKQVLTETVLWPLAYPDTFDRLGVAPPHGVLLYGPPGCGKTFLIRALAGTGQANVLPVKGAELLSKWVGESERGVRELFRRARQAAPALIFLDEVDALAPPRGQGGDSGVSDRVVAALLTELDGIETLRDVVVVAATNRPDRVDPALLRPGRLDRLVYVAPPDQAARADVLRAAARRTPLDPAVDLAALAGRTEGYSAADLAAVVREAALAAMRESTTASTVTVAHVEQALTAVRPSIRPESLAALLAFAAAQSGQASA
jgi:transitional endoplasmic reticulum ATPase